MSALSRPPGGGLSASQLAVFALPVCRLLPVAVALTARYLTRQNLTPAFAAQKVAALMQHPPQPRATVFRLSARSRVGWQPASAPLRRNPTTYILYNVTTHPTLREPLIV